MATTRLLISRLIRQRSSLTGEQRSKNQGVSQGVNEPDKLGSILSPDSAEHPLKPQNKTQNRAKRFNRLDNQNCFGTRGSEVQILSPRPIFSNPIIDLKASRFPWKATSVNFSPISRSWTFCTAIQFDPKHLLYGPPVWRGGPRRKPASAVKATVAKITATKEANFWLA